jgi:hypothetical protein
MSNMLPYFANTYVICLYSPVYIDPTRTPNWSGALPTDFSTYINSETESQSCVGGSVACNAAPAIPSPADGWTGPNDTGFPHA